MHASIHEPKLQGETWTDDEIVVKSTNEGSTGRRSNKNFEAFRRGKNSQNISGSV